MGSQTGGGVLGGKLSEGLATVVMGGGGRLISAREKSFMSEEKYYSRKVKGEEEEAQNDHVLLARKRMQMSRNPQEASPRRKLLWPGAAVMKRGVGRSKEERNTGRKGADRSKQTAGTHPAFLTGTFATSNTSARPSKRAAYVEKKRQEREKRKSLDQQGGGYCLRKRSVRSQQHGVEKENNFPRLRLTLERGLHNV